LAASISVEAVTPPFCCTAQSLTATAGNTERTVASPVVKDRYLKDRRRPASTLAEDIESSKH
jgi:hypothetical protein